MKHVVKKDRGYMVLAEGQNHGRSYDLRGITNWYVNAAKSELIDLSNLSGTVQQHLCDAYSRSQLRKVRG